MSEEEKQAIETMHTIVEFGGDNLLCREHRKRLQIVLNLISKQQKEILHWKGQYYLISRKINKPLEDKIKEKIKELKNDKNIVNSVYWDGEDDDYIQDYQIKVLQELLEEENV